MADNTTAAPAATQPEDHRLVTEADIQAAREHIADAHNGEQLRSAIGQLRRNVVIEMAARGLIPSFYGAAPAATQPEALRLAAWLNEGAWHRMTLGDVNAAGRELRRLHALTTAPAAQEATRAPTETEHQALTAATRRGARLIGRGTALDAALAAPAAQEAAPAVLQSGSVNGVLYVRYDLPEGLKEQALQDQLIALGWTPPGPRPQADAGAVPEGWRLVPVEPTEHMAMAGGQYAECGLPANAVFGYRAMLAAVPQPPAAAVAPAEPKRNDLVPGVLHCAKCKFQLNRVVLCVGDGNTYAGDSKTEPCPNGCGPLWPVTWEQEARNCWKGLEELHVRLQEATRAAAPTQEADPWEDINTLPNCDDPVWLYCQDTNTIDGPVAPRPHMAEDWTHWCPAEAPSTQAIDAARARQEGAQHER